MTEQEILTPKQEILDLATEAMTQKFAEAPIYAKSGVVEARVAEAEEEVTTVLEDGTVETVNTAQAGDYIVTNPGGEKYVLTPQKFKRSYETTEDAGVFKAKGMARAFQNDTGMPATIVPSWGGTQEGGADCMFATVYDPANPDLIGADRYIIGREEFLATYVPVEPQVAREIGGVALQ